MATTPEQRTRILNAILDSQITHPKENKTKTFVRSETQRIAASVFGRNPNRSQITSVAAVRANLTMGNYGNVTTLRKHRRNELSG